MNLTLFKFFTLFSNFGGLVFTIKAQNNAIQLTIYDFPLTATQWDAAFS